MSIARDIDRSSKLVLGLQRLAHARITVGVHEDVGEKAHPAGGTVASAATALEMGTSEHAPLAFVRGPVDSRKRSLARELADAATKVLRGESVDEAFRAPAAKLAAAMRKRVPVVTGTTREAIEARVNGEVVG